MEKQLDFRVQRTYKLLIDAMMNLLKEKSFDDITVGEICEKAMVRRATFYRHFEDKYEMFSFVIRQLLDQFKEENRMEYEQKQPQTFYIAMIDYCLQFVEQHEEVLGSLMESKSSRVLLEIMSEEIEQDILVRLRMDEKAGVLLPAKPELLAVVITGALVYTVQWWLLHNMDMPRKELVDVFTSLIRFF